MCLLPASLTQHISARALHSTGFGTLRCALILWDVEHDMLPLAPTLFSFSAFVLLLLSTLMYLIWRRDREPEELFWSAAFSMAGSAFVCFAFRNVNETVSIVAGNALALWACGLVWTGAVIFKGKAVHPLLSFAGGLMWLAGFWSAGIHLRIVAFAIVAAIYETLTTYELFSYNRAKDKPLLMSKVAGWIVGIHSGVDIIVAISGSFVEVDPGSPFTDSWVLQYRWLELSSYLAILGFVLIALSKERIAIRQESAAMIDALTGLANRRAFDLAIERAERSATGKDTTALLVFDLDNFKVINDRFGHPEGDRVLAAFGATAARNIRSGDVLARIGGEEFVILMCSVDRGTALSVAERIRSAFVEEASILVDGLATVSVGVAIMANRTPDFWKMTRAADRALYDAKAAGRNRVVLAGQ